MSFTVRNALALGAFSALAAAQTSPTPKLEADCEDVVIFMSRGNDAPYHDLRTFPFVEATCGKLKAQGKSCDYIDIEFDVTYGGPYCDQVAEGARNGISQITAFNKKCPCTHIVVNGYSQGAHVAGDVLGGPGGCEEVSAGLDSESAAGKAIAAALLWGDVTHTANQTYNVLDGADKDGMRHGRHGDYLTLLNRYSSVLRSYCQAGDPVCAGGDNVTQHLNYFDIYTDEGADFAVSQIAKAVELPSCKKNEAETATSTVAAKPTASSVASDSTTTVTQSATTFITSTVAPTPAKGHEIATPAPAAEDDEACDDGEEEEDCEGDGKGQGGMGLGIEISLGY